MLLSRFLLRRAKQGGDQRVARHGTAIDADGVMRVIGQDVEVAHWVSMTDEEKEVVWVRILAQGYPRRNT